MYLCFSFDKHCTVLLLVQFCIRWFSIQTKNVHFSLFWGGWKYCQSFVKPDHLLVKCLSLTWKTFASISSEQRIVKLHWDIEYGFFYLKNMIKTTKCQFYSLGFILNLPIFLKLNFVFLFVFKNYYEHISAKLKKKQKYLEIIEF